MSVVIETIDLTKHYGKTVAVDEISFTVREGQVFGFLGPNGSGKTTTIGLLLGILTPTGGEIRLFGRHGRGELHAARQRIGATLEYPNFYPYLSGRDNLRIVANVKGAAPTMIERVLDVVGLAPRADDRFKKYSLGMKQRLALAATMLGDPDLVILDEPANGLDPQGMREIRQIIGRMAEEGKTIFLSSHLLWEVERTCSHVAIIQEGRIIRQGGVAELLSGRVVAELRSEDLESLRSAVAAFPGASRVAVDEDAVIAELEGDDLSELNRFLAERGVYASHLARRQASLEDVFIELTGDEVWRRPAGDQAAGDPAGDLVTDAAEGGGR